MSTKASAPATEIHPGSYSKAKAHTGALAIPGLCGLIAVLALVAAAAGLFYSTDGESYEIITPRGEAVELRGQGLYHFDSVMKAAANRGSG